MKTIVKDPMAGRDKGFDVSGLVPAKNDVGFRKTLEGMGAKDIAYDDGTKGVTATVNGQKVFYDGSGFENKNGTLVGTKEQVNAVIQNPLTQVRQTGFDNGVFVGYDQNNNPTYNGQTLDTTGMVNVGGRWYGNGNYLQDAVKAVTNKYEDPYKGTRDTILDRLLNYEKFSYNPSNDENLQNAMELARRAAMRNAVDRGVGGSSIAEYAAASAANNLIPQYEDKAYQRYLGERDFLGQLMGYVDNASNYELNEYSVNNQNRIADRDYAANQQNIEDNMAINKEQTDYERAEYAKAQKINEAMQRVALTGVVSAEDAPTLGLPAGTTTLEAMQYLRGLALDVAQVMGYVPQWGSDLLGIPAGENTLAGEDAFRGWTAIPSGKYKTGGSNTSSSSVLPGGISINLGGYDI